METTSKSKSAGCVVLERMIKHDDTKFQPLAELLDQCNGFWNFDRALLVRASGTDGSPLNIETWNADSTWIDAYRDDLSGLLFFAEDVFGGQFAISDTGVEVVDPETGEREAFAASLEAWAERILDEPEELTGYPLLREWEEACGKLQVGYRLVPRVPFVCGGEFAIENLKATPEVEGMRLRGPLATKIASLPDGATIEFTIED